MAKQSFSVGQVLTAAQMTSLQQTAMLGGSTTAKTTSYTLVAADAGTVVSVNSTSATTITVNTGLFSAGDIVTIQNWGSGSVTITAGTATVNTAGSLIVPQYDGGVLYFTSASAAIYFDWVQAGATSPLTTKGDIWGYGSSDARIPIGTNGDVLTADSSQSLGLKWAAPAAASGFVGCFLYKSGNQSIATATQTVLTFENESYDTDGFHSTTSNTGRITIPSGKGGKYLIGGMVAALESNGSKWILTTINGGSIMAVFNFPVNTTVSGYNSFSNLYNLTAGDYVEVLYEQNHGANRNVYGGTAQDTNFYCIYLGA